MKNQKFCERLRFYRLYNKLEVKDVAEELSNRVKPISPKSIYSWENGTTQPSADMFMSLCEIYQIDGVLNAFGFEVDDDDSADVLQPLTEEEKDLILAYREHPEHRDTVRKIYDLK